MSECSVYSFNHFPVLLRGLYDKALQDMSSEAYFAFKVLHRSIATDEVVPVIVFGDRVLPSRQISSRMFYAVACFLVVNKTFAVDSPTRMMVTLNINIHVMFTLVLR